MTDSAGARLGDRQVYVSQSAAEQYQAWAGIPGIEEARRELTDLLVDARPNGPDALSGEVERWRLRSRSQDLDIQAQVVVEGRRAVVVGVHCRGIPRAAGSPLRRDTPTTCAVCSRALDDAQRRQGYRYCSAACASEGRASR